MSQNRSPRFRPSAFDHLEDRAVPSGGVSYAQVSAAATRVTASARLQTQLATAGNQIGAAYATFASGVRQLELTLINPANGTIPNSVTSTSAVATSTVLPQVQALVTNLASSVTAALGNIPRAARQSNVIAAGLTGTSPGSLATQMTRLFNAASVNNGVVQGNLGLLFTAVDSAVSGSYEATSIQGYLAAIGRPGRSGTSNSPSAFNLTTFGLQNNSAFATFATTTRSAELNLPVDAPNSVAAQTAVIQAETTIVNAASALGQNATAGLSGTTAAPFAGLLQSRVTGPSAGSLISQLTNLINTASPQNSVPSYSLSLLYAAVDAATNATFKATAIDGFLIGLAVPSTTGVVVTPSDTTNDPTSPSIIGDGNGVTLPITTGGGVGLGGTGFGPGTPSVGLGTGTGTIGLGTGTIGTGTGLGTTGITGTTGTGTGTDTTGTGTGTGRARPGPGPEPGRVQLGLGRARPGPGLEPGRAQPGPGLEPGRAQPVPARCPPSFDW